MKRGNIEVIARDGDGDVITINQDRGERTSIVALSADDLAWLIHTAGPAALQIHANGRTP